MKIYAMSFTTNATNAGLYQVGIIFSNPNFMTCVATSTLIAVFLKKTWLPSKIDIRKNNINNLRITEEFKETVLNKIPLNSYLKKFRFLIIFNPYLSEKKFNMFCKKHMLSYTEGLIVLVFSRSFFLGIVVRYLLVPLNIIIYLNVIGYIFFLIPTVVLKKSPYVFLFLLYLLILILINISLSKLNKIIDNRLFIK